MYEIVLIKNRVEGSRTKRSSSRYRTNSLKTAILCDLYLISRAKDWVRQTNKETRREESFCVVKLDDRQSSETTNVSYSIIDKNSEGFDL